MAISENVIDFVYIDMDGVVADFDISSQKLGQPAGTFKYRPGAYAYLPVYLGAKEAVAELRRLFPKRVWFLTKPPKNAPYVFSEKALWIREHFGDEGLEHLIITMDKSHVGTDRSVLIDDRPHKGGVEHFRGAVVKFGGALPVEEHWTAALGEIEKLVQHRETIDQFIVRAGC